MCIVQKIILEYTYVVLKVLCQVAKKKKKPLPNPYRVNTTIPYSSTLLYLEGIWECIYEIIGCDDNSVILFITTWSERHKRRQCILSFPPLLSPFLLSIDTEVHCEHSARL